MLFRHRATASVLRADGVLADHRRGAFVPDGLVDTDGDAARAHAAADAAGAAPKLKVAGNKLKADGQDVAVLAVGLGGRLGRLGRIR